jgi:ribose transport system ATP-binding protein
VGSKAQIYQLIGDLAAQGKAVVFVSSYLPELLGVCDTIGVMTRGVLSEVRPASAWTEHDIISAAVATPAERPTSRSAGQDLHAQNS